MSNERKPYVIGHKDRNLINNHVKNLEWIKLPINVSNSDVVDDGPKTIEEIKEYMNEACDKVWLTRTHPDDDPDIEVTRVHNVNRILDTYIDIPENGYTSWEIGYWNGILGALRWVLGDDKDFLDT